MIASTYWKTDCVTLCGLRVGSVEPLLNTVLFIDHWSQIRKPRLKYLSDIFPVGRATK